MAILHLEYKSQALMRGAKVTVILPSDGVGGLWESPYKTLYFLPGYSATAMELVTYLGLREQSELKGIAIVLPEGENLFYQDMPERMIFYSTYVGKELVEETRKLLPLSKKREDTFIGGISMGGYGALYNGIKFRDTFSKVVAFSPAADACMLMTKEDAPGFSKEQFCGIFGDEQSYYNSACNMEKEWTIPRENRPELFLCCGKEDRAVYDAVEKLETALKEHEILHMYREEHGDHEFAYWKKMLDPAFSFLSGIKEGTKNELIIEKREEQ